VGMTEISRRRLEGMPEMADMVADELLSKLALCASCDGLISRHVLDDALLKVQAWKARYGQAPVPEEGLLIAWEVMGLYCQMGTIVGFIQGQALERMHAAGSGSPTSPDTCVFLRTDSAHRANAILYTRHYPTFMTKVDGADWIRLRNSLSVHVQGSIVAADTRPDELLYDISCHLGMPTDADMDDQIQWMERRMDSLVWVTKLIRQGCFASLMFVVGTVLFGQDFPMHLMAAVGAHGGHKLEVSAQFGQLSVTASVKFSIRDAEMEVIGELPLSIRVMIRMDADGSIRAFQMSADLQLKKCPVDWEAIRKRVRPLL